MIHGLSKAAARESLCAEPYVHNAQTITLALTYSLPAICGSDVDTARLANADLAAMTLAEIETEAFRLRMVLAFGDRRNHPWAYDWIQSRLAKCQELSDAG
jgi:hypothetical protein